MIEFVVAILTLAIARLLYEAAARWATAPNPFEVRDGWMRVVVRGGQPTEAMCVVKQIHLERASNDLDVMRYSVDLIVPEERNHASM